MGTLTIVCNWCNPARTIGTKHTNGPDGVTNTICELHTEEMDRQINEIRIVEQQPAAKKLR